MYDIYDDCPRTAEWLRRSGKSQRWLLKYLRSKMNSNTMHLVNDELRQLSGGYDWSCGGMDAMVTYLSRADVKRALHLGESGQSRFSYDTSGPASITLYPKLVKKVIFVFNFEESVSVNVNVFDWKFVCVCVCVCVYVLVPPLPSPLTYTFRI